MYNFDEILKYNNLNHIDYEHPVDDVYEMKIPYTNNTTLHFISSLISDLSNNGFDVHSSIKYGVANIKAIKNPMPSQYASRVKKDEKEISISAAYYMIKRWVDKLNKKLDDLQVEVEKVDEGYYNYGKKRQVTKRYGKDSTFYIINPEVNQEELIEIVDFLDTYNVPLQPHWFRRINIFPVSESPFLLEKGYSPNETYLAFPIEKDPINFNPYSNLKKGDSLVWKEEEETA